MDNTSTNRARHVGYMMLFVILLLWGYAFHRGVRSHDILLLAATLLDIFGLLVEWR